MPLVSDWQQALTLAFPIQLFSSLRYLQFFSALPRTKEKDHMYRQGLRAKQSHPCPLLCPPRCMHAVFIAPPCSPHHSWCHSLTNPPIPRLKSPSCSALKQTSLLLCTSSCSPVVCEMGRFQTQDAWKTPVCYGFVLTSWIFCSGGLSQFCGFF